MEEHVSYGKDGEIPTIILKRSNNNPLNLDTINQLIEKIQLSDTNEDICLVIKADGDNFTVGADLKYIYEILIKQENYEEFTRFSKQFQELTRTIINHPGAIIMGLHGWVVGGGFELTLAADLRIAATDTKIKLPELSIGTMFSNGSTKLLSQIIGLGRAKELMLLGNQINAQQAYEIGLVNYVCERKNLNETLRKYANEIIQNNDADALSVAKRLLNDNIDLDMEGTLKSELDALQKFGLYGNFKSKIEEFMKK